MLEKLASLLLLAALVSLTAGCNTFEGFGQDVQAGGRAIEKAADKSKPR
jgi:predicted small secreted protein